MERLVVDASVAAKWLTLEEHSTKALTLVGSGLVLVAPDVVIPELGNVIVKWCRIGVTSRESGRRMTADLPGIGLQLTPSVELIGAALEIALTHQRSIYDSLYVALAVRERCQLVTADLRLYNALKDALPETMLWVGDISPGSGEAPSA